jgi:hypothetical protein
MCSILWWILSIWEALGWIFRIFDLIHALSKRGRIWAYFGLLNAFGRFSGGFELFLGSLCQRSDRSWSPVWPVRVMVLFICWASAWPVVVTGRPVIAELMQLLCFHQVFCMHSSRWSCIDSRGDCMFAGGALCGFRFSGLCSLLEHSFVSDVSSCYPCLRCPRLVFFMWSFSLHLFGFRSLVGVYFYSFLFFFFSLRLLYVCAVNSLIKGEIEDHVWFEDRWMVAS